MWRVTVVSPHLDAAQPRAPHHRTMAPSPECVTRPEQHRQHRFLVRFLNIQIDTFNCGDYTMFEGEMFRCDQIPRYKNPGSRPDYFWHQTAKIDFIEKAGLHLWPVVTRIRPIASSPDPMFESKCPVLVSMGQ